MPEHKRRRCELIDFLRAAAIVNMVAFHFCYDYFVVLGHNVFWPFLLSSRVWERMICCTFIGVSGVSHHFSRSNYKKGFIVNLCGALVTIVTVLFLPSEAIFFGVLSLLGCSAWLAEILQPLLRKIRGDAGLIASLLLFVITYNLQVGYLTFGPLHVALPKVLYESFHPLVVLGLPYAGFMSSDYFPLMPWFFWYLAGYFLWKIPQIPQLAEKVRLPGVALLSHNSLLIYMLHQPVCLIAAIGINMLL